MRHFSSTAPALVLLAINLFLVACGSTRSSLREQSLEARASGASASDEAEFIAGSSVQLDAADNTEIVFASQDTSDCDAAHIECFRKCWKKKPPRPYEYHKRDHYRHCETKCFKEYQACLKRQGLLLREFPTMGRAAEWLRLHKKEILIGSIVVVAGATFIVATGGAGAGVLILVPLAAM